MDDKVYAFRRFGVWHVVTEEGPSLFAACGVEADGPGMEFDSFSDAWRFMDARGESEHCPECMVTAASFFTARDIVTALHGSGYLDAAWVNTGGNVYNVWFAPVCQHGTALGAVRVSDNGDWTASDFSTPADSVTVLLDAPDGGEVDFAECVTSVRDVVATVEEFAVRAEDFCAACVADRTGE